MRLAIAALVFSLFTSGYAKVNRNPDVKEHYAIIVDAGSSGSRLQIYAWDSVKKDLKGKKPTFPDVDEQVNKKIQPGLSTFAKTPKETLRTELDSYWKFLLDLAIGYVPKGTTFYLFATAGMRLLGEEERQRILYTSCEVIQATGHFEIGSCEDHIRVIDGNTEGIYGWLAVNYLRDSFKPFYHTFGMLDMGGASQQIAFETNAQDPDAVKVCLNMGDSGRIGVYHVFVKTFLGFGMQETRLKYLSRIREAAEIDQGIKAARSGGADEKQEGEQSASDDSGDSSIQIDTVTVKEFDDPCLPEGLEVTEDDQVSDGEHLSSIMFKGTGNFDECHKQLLPLLQGTTFPAAPKLNFQDHIPFVGVSEYWYSSHDIFNLGGGKYTPSKFFAMGQALCGSPWWIHEQMLSRNLYPRKKGIDLDRARFQCFKAAWMLAVLHDGFKLPWEGKESASSVDPQRASRFKQMMRLIYDYEDDIEGDAQGESCPQDRVLGICPVPTVKHFQSALEVGGREVSWALGAALMIVMAEKGHNPFSGTCPFTEEEIKLGQPSTVRYIIELIAYRIRHVKALKLLAICIAILVGFVIFQKAGGVGTGKKTPLKVKEHEN